MYMAARQSSLPDPDTGARLSVLSRTDTSSAVSPPQSRVGDQTASAKGFPCTKSQKYREISNDRQFKTRTTMWTLTVPERADTIAW